ncbi:hypothetical protein HPULCUR_000147 [Helicostylum pulchrum]|uniref:Telomerase reverse transcriptase n=1 Tax=Helicostylum pulchrum TaxID=562976 RepID=A0ABP9XKA6_9FUNG
MCQVPEYFYRLFKSVQTLEDYLGESIDQCKTEDVKTLLQTHLVIKSNRDCDNFSRWKKFVADKKLTLHCIEPKRLSELSTVLDRLAFYMNKDWKVNNALSSGISIVSTFNVEVLSHKVENTTLNQMKDSEVWNAVLSCLGEDSFCKLLLDYIILHRLPNNIFHQISGQLISTNLWLSENHIDRSKMFFADTIINSKTSKPLMALPKPHMFHPKQETGIRYAVTCTSIIFSKEFVSERKGKTFLKRFAQIPYLIEHIHARHSKTSCIDVLNKTCPTKTSAVNIADAASTYKEVANFVTNQLKKVFPISFWGSKDNFDAIHNGNIKECQWLVPPSKTDIFVPSDLKRREQVLYQMLTWLFRSYIIPVVKSMFYVTESAKNPNKLLYFRQDTWNILTREAMPLLMKNYTLVDKNSLQYVRIGSARVRFLPKGTGFRTITNMSSSTTVNYKSLPSPNETFRPVLNVLKFEKERNPELMGSSVLGKNLFYNRLKEYKSKQVNTEKLYFVKADIQNCFDTIDQEILMGLLKDILKSKDGYVKRKVSAIRPFGNMLVKEDFDFSAPSDQMAPVYDQAQELKKKHFGSIIVDQNDYSIDSLEEIIALLEESISMSTVKVGNDYYQRIKGIAQGSNLSTLLCSFFLGKFEQDKLAFTKDDPTGILFTYVDDFLYITKNRSYAKWVLNVMVYGK